MGECYEDGSSVVPLLRLAGPIGAGKPEYQFDPASLVFSERLRAILSVALACISAIRRAVSKRASARKSRAVLFFAGSIAAFVGVLTTVLPKDKGKRRSARLRQGVVRHQKRGRTAKERHQSTGIRCRHVGPIYLHLSKSTSEICRQKVARKDRVVFILFGGSD
jgi:hypothetical protein